jgi:hypothetical protein
MAEMRLDTLTLRYWQDFELAEGELEYLSELLIEEESPLSVEGLAQRLMARRVTEEKAVWDDRKAKGLIYQPREAYAQGDRLVFSALGDAAGVVVAVRPGRHPEYSPFDVIQVRMEGDGELSEFAASLSHPHALNFIAVDEDEDLAPDDLPALSSKLLERYGECVIPVLLERLRESPEFVSFGEEWFLRGFLLPTQEGHLNLAEAVLDLAGGFASSEEMLDVLEMPKESGRAVQLFSLNHALATDEQGRFKFAGTDGRIEWCLPRVAETKPLRFEKGPSEINVNHVLDEVVEIVGEGAPTSAPGAAVQRWSHVLTFYDWYWGHLPYDKGARDLLVRPLLEGQRCTRLQLRLGKDGEIFPVVLYYASDREMGWWGSAELRAFFERQEIVPGATIVIERTAKSDSEGLYEIDYHRAPATKLEMLDYEESGQPVFRRIAVRCEVNEEMSLPRSRFSALETLKLLDEGEARVARSLLAAAFQRVGEKMLRGLGIVYRASFNDLLVATNIERPHPGTILRGIFEQEAYPCFYLDVDGYYAYDPSRSQAEVNKVRLTSDEAILDAGSSDL